MQTQTNQKGLSGFALKYLAAALMLLDHIHYFFAFTGKVPLFFSWLGRLAAPLFLFCIIEGFVHTHDRLKYFMRIYLLSILMGLIHFSFYNIGSVFVRGDGFFPQNQMLASFAILLVVLQGIDWCQKKQWTKGLAAIFIPLLLPYLFVYLLTHASNPTLLFSLNLSMFTVLPLHTFILDGGTSTLLCGILLYLFRKHPIRQAAAFIITCLLYDVGLVILGGANLKVTDFFTQAYQWMEVFAVIPMLCYNGTRGTGSKTFFYWFYPVHIYVLYALSCVIYQFL